MRIACWISKTTDTHTEYEIRIAFAQQLRLHECASILRLYKFNRIHPVVLYQYNNYNCPYINTTIILKMTILVINLLAPEFGI